MINLLNLPYLAYLGLNVLREEIEDNGVKTLLIYPGIKFIDNIA
jgi:hypothetical protein